MHRSEDARADPPGRDGRTPVSQTVPCAREG
jgi:hypothetical protein